MLGLRTVFIGKVGTEFVFRFFMKHTITAAVASERFIGFGENLKIVGKKGFGNQFRTRRAGIASGRSVKA